MSARNPKQDGTLLYDAVPQTGECPIRCNQCFYNRPGAFFASLDEPHLPDPASLPLGAIVRMNSGHDSNIQRPVVFAAAKLYDRVFFNTSIRRLDFPGPVVLTANPREEARYWPAPDALPPNLMFVRFRVSPSNAELVRRGVAEWTAIGAPCVLTFMRYYDKEPGASTWPGVTAGFEFRKSILNEYWCPTRAFVEGVLAVFAGNPLVRMCGQPGSSYCRDCGNCERFYHEAAGRLDGLREWLAGE